MRLLVDIGNTEATVGLSEGGMIRGRWRLTSSHERTPDEWAVAIDSFVVRAGHAPAEIRAACLGSVVPAVTQAIVDAIRSVFTSEIGQVTPRSELPLTLDVDEP
ncbi:MAG TPA: type III pantothenate kinase, partial [Gemmatimonadales bacterium]|nr:type III pantothenate kinase [Gemmatimonadales bacterium]